MREYHAMIDQQKEKAKQEERKNSLSYKISKGMDKGNHEIIQAISYAEYHTNKLNAQRPFDRPYGNAERTTYENTDTKETTYSTKQAKMWKAQGFEVIKRNAQGVITEIMNSHKSTRRMYAGIHIKYTYNRPGK